MDSLKILLQLIPTFLALETMAFLFIILFLRFLTPINWFESLYNDNNFSKKDIPNSVAVKVVQSVIVGVHIFLGLLVLGTFFAI